MFGAIAGDIIGSVYESAPVKHKNFPLFHSQCCFTDDSVLTIAVAKAILEKTGYASCVKEIGNRYPHAGYGGSFNQWLFCEESKPYNSWGNGSAMRVSPVGFAFETIEEVLLEAADTAQISHNHPEGIKGAQATAMSIFLARITRDRNLINKEISTRFGYDLNRTLAEIRPDYSFDISCQGTVPEAIISFLESTSYEDAVRNAVSLGGDSDTLACITGGIAEAYYGPLSSQFLIKVKSYLPDDLLHIAEQFYEKYVLKEK